VCLLPFGHIFFKQADLWHAQGQFFQAGLLIIFSLSLFEKPKYQQVINKPLGAFILWAGLLTSYFWIKIFVTSGNYPIKIFMPFFNILCIVWFYKLCTEYLDRKDIAKIFKWLRYSVILLLLYCTLQYFKLDEFLSGLADSGDQLVGTIGNPSHLAGYLALLSPLFFNKKGVLPLILLWFIILLTGSASGLFTALVVLVAYLLIKRRFWLGGGVSFLACFGGVVLLLTKSNFFTSSHRLEVWRMALEVFKGKPITGFGLGSFALNKFYINRISSIWRHAHNEYLQISFELGIIGLVLILWVIFNALKDGWTLRKDNNGAILISIFVGFICLSCFTFTMHLWQISVLAMMVYSFIYVLKNNSEPQVLGAS